MDDPKSTAKVVYASEIQIVGTGVEVASTETAFSEIGFTITDAAPRFFRYDLTGGATFVTNPTLAIDTAGTTSTAAAAIVQASGGAGEAFVLFEVSTAAAGNITGDAIATMSLGAATPNLGLAGSATIAYNLYEFGAGGGNGLLASAGPNTFAGFVPASTAGTAASVGAAPGTPVEQTKLIDVSLDSLLFESGVTGTDTTSLGSIYLTDAPFGANDVTGTPVFRAGVTASSVTTVTGDFSAAKKVWLEATTCTASPGLMAGVISMAEDEVVFPTSNTPNFGTTSVSTGGTQQVDTVANVCIQVNGTDPIPEAAYDGLYEPVAVTGYALSDTPLPLATLGNTGTTVFLNLQLTPAADGGQYKNYFRITNTSQTTGRVFMRLINDDGDTSAAIDMETIYNDGVNTVVGQGSSRQFDIDAVYAAVQLADPTFAIGASPTRKLRTVITGEFGSMDVQTYTVSTDQTTFSTF
ncbi:MAG: hypothetical protein ABJ308_16865 [Halieaceae bacterium]